LQRTRPAAVGIGSDDLRARLRAPAPRDHE
jgi:hypothetical protein